MCSDLCSTIFMAVVAFHSSPPQIRAGRMSEIMEVQVGNPRSTACLVKGDFYTLIGLSLYRKTLWLSSRRSCHSSVKTRCTSGVMGTVRDSQFLVCRNVNSLRCISTSDHSLRRTFTVKLVQAKVFPKISRRLLVHQAGNDVESRVYLGSLKYDVMELSDALEAVRFPMMI